MNSEERMERYGKVLTNITDLETMRMIIIGIVAFALLYVSSYVMQILAQVVTSFKVLKSAVNKPA